MKPPTIKYEHIFTIRFGYASDKFNPSMTPDMLRRALLFRIIDLDKGGSAAWKEACGDSVITFPITTN